MILAVQPHLKKNVDLLKTLKIAIIHDLVEAEIGDICYAKTNADRELQNKKNSMEKEEIKRIKKLIGGELGQEVFELWSEFEEGKSEEAMFVKAIDSLEANFQSIMLRDISYWDKEFYKLALTKADKYCEHEKILHDINEEVKRRTEGEIKKLGVDVERIKKEIVDEKRRKD